MGLKQKRNTGLDTSDWIMVTAILVTALFIGYCVFQVIHMMNVFAMEMP